jgi:hypothetical protein
MYKRLVVTIESCIDDDYLQIYHTLELFTSLFTKCTNALFIKFITN